MMRSFQRNRGGRDDRRGDRGDRRMYNATCAECGSSCEVPFQPSFDKPVYCSECFQAKRRSEDGDRGGRDDRRDSRRDDRGGRDERRSAPDNSGKHFEALNIKLDKIISLLSQNAEKTAKKEFVEMPAIEAEEKNVEKSVKKAAPAKKAAKADKKVPAKKAAVKKAKK